MTNIVGAIEFLHKLNSICTNRSTCNNCPCSYICHSPTKIKNISEAVQKVMTYKLLKSPDEYLIENEKSMIRNFGVCANCQENCEYDKDNNKKNCPKVNTY